jgi:hypothetical protein
MATPVREAALAAVAARLRAQLPDVALDRARRGAVDAERERLPRMILRGGDMEVDDTQEPGWTHYRIVFSVVAFARAGSDLDLEQALSSLHARIVAALAGWVPSGSSLGDVTEEGAEFLLYDVEDSAKPAGECVARFSILAVTPTGDPNVN